MSSPPWPTSTATAITSRAGLLGEVRDGDGGVQTSGVRKNDPLGHGVLPSKLSVSIFGVARPVGELVGQRLAAGDVAGHDEDGVVAGDGADDVGQPGPVQRAGQELRRARRGAQHGDVAAGVDPGEQLAQQPEQPGRARPRPRAAAACRPRGSGTAPADLDRAQLLQVAGEGGLGDLHAVGGEQFGQLGLRPDRPGPGSARRSGRAARRGSPARSSPVRVRSAELAASSQASSAFWACSRFSAWSKTALCGPSITSSVISSPRCAGRQCSTIASGAAAASSFSLTWYGRNGVSRSRPSLSCPIDVQVSVATTSAPSAASNGSRSTSTEPPVHAAISAARATTAGRRVEPGRPGDPHVHPGGRARPAGTSGPCCSPRPRRTRASGPSVAPSRSRMVSRSASSWQGWKPSVSALTTGTSTPEASSASRSSPVVRKTMAAT